jgi:arylsulfatase A-like enzyme
MQLPHVQEAPPAPGPEASRPGRTAEGGASLPTIRIGPSQILALAVWFGVLTGLGELAAVGLRVLCGGDPVVEWPELLWMAPMADVLFLLVPGLLLALVAWLRPGVISLRLIAFVYFTGTFACLLYHILVLSSYARALLALGLGVQTGRTVARHPQLLGWLVDWTTRWVRLPIGRFGSRAATPAASTAAAEGNDLVNRRQVLVSSTLTVTGLTAGVSGWKWLRERRALASLPPADPGQPNVLFLVLDTVRAQSLSLHGYSRATTPNLERLARKGVTFRRATASAPWTLPSHATMFTGRWLSETGVNLNIPLGSRYRTLAEVLSARGYQTAGFVGNTDILSPYYGLNRGFAHYDCHRPSLGQILRTSALTKRLTDNPQLRELVGYYQILGRKTAAELSQNLFDWLEARDGNRPFFAFLNYYDAHEPYIPSGETAAQFGLRTPKYPRVDCYKTYPQNEIDVLRVDYDRCILGLDAEIGRVVKWLEDRGFLENTVVIVTSDHGEHFGEHGLMEHACSLYTPLLHVPLILLHPSRVPTGEVFTQGVSLRNLPATILDLVGSRGQELLPGDSLARFWEAGRVTREGLDQPVLSEATPLYNLARRGPISKGPMKSLLWREYHYIRNGDGIEELYHVEADPLEETNLAGSAGVGAVLERLRTSLEADT